MNIKSKNLFIIVTGGNISLIQTFSFGSSKVSLLIMSTSLPSRSGGFGETKTLVDF